MPDPGSNTTTKLRPLDRGELQTLADTMPQLVWMFDASGTPTYFNRRWVEYTGDTALGPATWTQHVHPVDLGAALEQWRYAVANGKDFQIEHRLRRHDGAWCWFLARMVPAHDEHGVIERWVGTLTDVDDFKRIQESEHRRVRQALLVAEVGRTLASDLTTRSTLERCVQAIVNHLDAAFARIWTLDPRAQVLELEASAGMYTHINGGHARIPVGQFKIGRIAATREPHMTNDVAHDTAIDAAWATKERLVSFAGYPLLVDERVVGVIGMFSRHELPDDTLETLRSVGDAIAVGVERKVNSEAFLRSEQRYELAMRATKDAVWDWDLRTDEVTWNDGLCEQFGFAQADVGHDTTWWLSRVHPDDRDQVFRSLHEVVENGGRDWSADYRFQREDGRYAEVNDRAFVSRDAKLRPLRMVGVMEDVTQRRRNERGMQLLARAGVRLATSADTLEACRRIAELVVPTLADWSIVDLVSGELVERVAFAHRDRSQRALLERLAEFSPRLDAETGVGAVLRSGQTEWVPDARNSDFRGAMLNASHKEVTDQLGIASYVRVPLVARGRTLGVLNLIRTKESPPHDTQDVRVAQELALRAALSIDTVQVLNDAQSSEQQLRALVENLPELAWSARPDGYIDYFNRRWYDYTGTTFQQMEGWGWRSVHDPAFLAEVEDRYRESLRTGQPFEMEYPLRGANGTFRWFLTRTTPLRGADGRIVRWFGTNTDVDDQRQHAKELERLATEQSQVQQRLRDEADRLGLLNRVGKQLSSEMHADTIAQEVVDVAARLTGAKIGAFFYNVTDQQNEKYLLVAVAGADRAKLSHLPMPRNTAMFDETFSGRGVVRLDDVTTDARFGKNAPFMGLPAGHPDVKSYLAVPVTSRDGTVLGGLFFGHERAGIFSERAELLVTGLASQAAIAMDNARLFGEARRLIEALERSNQELDKFAYVASHDLKAPLRGISNLSQWIEDDIKATANAETLDHLRLLRGRVLRLEALINGVLHYARAGRGKTSVESVDVNALVAEVFELLAPPPGAVLEQVTPMPVLQTDRTELQQVLMNLVGNALKYGASTPGDPGTAHVEVSAEEQPAQWIFAVRDHGKGIAPEFHARIWGLFQTLQARDVVESTGIGLAVVRKVVENRGGTAWIESTPGEGATFKFSWPR